MDRHGAADQRQLDICGEALDTFLTADNLGFQMARSGWLAVRKISTGSPATGTSLTKACGNPTGDKNFTYGRLQSGVSRRGRGCL